MQLPPYSLLAISTLFVVSESCYHGVTFFKGTEIGEPIRTEHPFGCQKLCANNAACKAWTWTTQGHSLFERRLCHRFSSVTGYIEKDYSISGPKLCPKGDCALTNVNFLSLRLSTFHRIDSPNAQHCYAKCLAEKECKAWSWVKKSVWRSFDNSRCYIRTEIDSATSRETGGMSGLRDCNPQVSLTREKWRPDRVA